MDKVSIIIPCYNVAQYINDTFLSVVNQTYKNIEIIFVNDGSTDHTLDILNTFISNEINIKNLNVENGGVSRARNIGIANAD